MISSEEAWQKLVVTANASIKKVISILNDTGLKIILVVNEEDQLVGTISDGDIRRGLLKSLNIDDSIESIIHRNPMVVPVGLGRDLIVNLMRTNKVHQLPVVDQNNHIVGLYLWDELITPPVRENVMVIMAGGLGVRLRPHTESCPKPMLPIAGKPMLEHIIDRAKLEGFNNFVLAIHYLGDVIEDYFGNGSKFDVNIEYLREQTPLGTAGALSLFDRRPTGPFIVTNGDVITDIRYGELLDFHIRNGGSATMAVRVYEWQHPFGVVQTDGINILGFDEKPIARSHVNAGVYVLDPIALNHLSVGSRCDMPNLFDRLKSQSLRALAYPMHESWIDVGRPTDYRYAENILSEKQRAGDIP